MILFTIDLDPVAAALYQKIALTLGKPTEQVLSEALFRLAGELSLEALQNLEPPGTLPS